MSEPVTAERFEEFVEIYTQNHAETIAHFDRIDATLTDHTARLRRLESNLEIRTRLDKIEVLLAEQFGPDVVARAGL